MRPRTMYRFTPIQGRVSYFESLPNAVRARRERGGELDTLQCRVGLLRSWWLEIAGRDCRLPEDYTVLRHAQSREAVS